MKVKIQTKEKMNEEISQLFINLVNENPNCVLGLATGSSPLGVYQKIVDAYQKGAVSFKQVKTFNLDEYVGLGESNDQSYRYFMNHNLFDHIDIEKENTHVPSGKVDENSNPEEYDAMKQPVVLIYKFLELVQMDISHLMNQEHLLIR